MTHRLTILAEAALGTSREEQDPFGCRDELLSGHFGVSAEKGEVGGRIVWLKCVFAVSSSIYLSGKEVAHLLDNRECFAESRHDE